MVKKIVIVASQMDSVPSIFELILDVTCGGFSSMGFDSVGVEVF